MKRKSLRDRWWLTAILIAICVGGGVYFFVDGGDWFPYIGIAMIVVGLLNVPAAVIEFKERHKFEDVE